jgi:ABC-type nitrate/sulfonate/bicarbonate transport system permease component
MAWSWRALAIPVALLLVWEIGADTGWLDLEFLSRPSHILIAGISGLADGTFLFTTWQTLEAALFGLSIALVVGVLAGIVLGLSAFSERMSRPVVESLRSIPSIALAPLSLLLFGFGLPMEGMIVAYACTWPILITTTAAVRNIEPRLIEVSRALEMSAFQRVTKIIVPAVTSRVLVGLRTAVGFALVVAVTVEILINPRGLGYGLMIAQQSLRIDVMYAYLVWLAILGIVVNALLRLADQERAA